MSFSSKQKGFTLIEILIVAALISLFAGLAIINIQQQFKASLKKAVIGEVRNLSVAYDAILQNNVGVFPKLCFVMQHLSEIEPYLDVDTGRAISGFDYIGHPLTGSTLNRIKTNWQGPYFASSQTRQNVAQGRGGNCRGRFLSGDAKTYVLLMPCDPYPNPFHIPSGSPYVLYLLKIKKDANGDVIYRAAEPDQLPKPMYEFITKPTDIPDLVAVVSYGPNAVPGGPEVLADAEKTRRKALRLYTESTDLKVADFELRRRAWYQDDPNNEKAMAFFDLVKGPKSDDIYVEF